MKCDDSWPPGARRILAGKTWRIGHDPGTGLTGLHGRTDGPAGERLYADGKGITDKEYREVRWPAVTQHPVTGRPILFVNPMHTHGFVGMTREQAWR